MTVQKFYKRSVITAEQFDGTRKMADKYGLCYSYEVGKEDEFTIEVDPETGKLVKVDDWFVPQPDGTHTMMTPEQFAGKYAPLPVLPQAVGEYIKWGKTYGIPTYMMFSFKFVRGQGFSKLTDEVEDWIISNSDAFALACLLDDWEVEDEAS